MMADRYPPGITVLIISGALIGFILGVTALLLGWSMLFAVFLYFGSGFVGFLLAILAGVSRLCIFSSGSSPQSPHRNGVE